MRAHTTLALLALLALLCAIALASGCEHDQMQTGCKIHGASCECGYGCKSEYMYRTRRACMNAYRERNSNMCLRSPCLRGICIQTTQDPGFDCKCAGTGFYGQRCEKACPTIPMRGVVFSHECVVI